ncbi:hypothetical protein DOTSEDRAFT_71593 [Dothistroma septosporum NZE10]|uniref:Uncharacterized protein n=1 Tax=Dothistroma septosporum (strain NZE10 / CBS 128990) TaxID=675120 RepID=N1PJX0_DOTSN|nr:hypothetical protein DOTSEDRAFT_71593 [Dothistroma septosporum NZE10]
MGIRGLRELHHCGRSYSRIVMEEKQARGNSTEVALSGLLILPTLRELTHRTMNGFQIVRIMSLVSNLEVLKTFAGRGNQIMWTYTGSGRYCRPHAPSTVTQTRRCRSQSKDDLFRSYTRRHLFYEFINGPARKDDPIVSHISLSGIKTRVYGGNRRRQAIDQAQFVHGMSWLKTE